MIAEAAAGDAASTAGAAGGGMGLGTGIFVADSSTADIRLGFSFDNLREVSLQVIVLLPHLTIQPILVIASPNIKCILHMQLNTLPIELSTNLSTVALLAIQIQGGITITLINQIARPSLLRAAILQPLLHLPTLTNLAPQLEQL